MPLLLRGAEHLATENGARTGFAKRDVEGFSLAAGPVDVKVNNLGEKCCTNSRCGETEKASS